MSLDQYAPERKVAHLSYPAMEKFLPQIHDQHKRTNILLEIQSKLLKKQYDRLEILIHLLEEMVQQQQQVSSILQKELVSLLRQPLLDKNKVMDILNIKDSTYRRYVAKGYLRPMYFEKVDWYFESDLKKALEESRRKGRI